MNFSRIQNPELGVLLLGWIQGLFCILGSLTPPVWMALLCLNPIFAASAKFGTTILG